jgi:hypothetical protein
MRTSTAVRLPRRPTADGAARWLLLGMVLVGLLAVRLLSGHDTAGQHRVLIPASAATATQSDQAVAPAVLAAWTAIDEPTGSGHAIVAGCELLLLTVVVYLLAGAARRRQTARPPSARSVESGRLRGPPPSLCRRALCVERI